MNDPTTTGIDHELVFRNTLLAANESAGLYELVWWLHSRVPETDIATKYLAAQEGLRRVLSEGLATLVYAFHPGPRDDESIPPQMWEEVLARPTAWYPVDHAAAHGGTVEIRITPVGERRLEETDTSELFDGKTRVRASSA